MQSLPPVLEILGQRQNYIRTAPPDAFKSTTIDIIHEEPPQPLKEKPKLDMKDFNSRSKQTQCEEAPVFTQVTQTDDFSSSSKLVQTESENFSSKAVQTEPEKQRTKTRSRFESTIHIMDQETSTELKIEEMLEEYSKMKAKFESLHSYKEQETSRIEKINKCWASQFHEVKVENVELKKKIENLQIELKNVQKSKEEVPVVEALTKTYSHSKLREDLLQKFFVNDDHFLRKCDPYYYFDLEDPCKSQRSENFSVYEDPRLSDGLSMGKFK
jgi:L-alanine-DL-glutamate epimerase-like enolase superfamily enzyme